MLTLHNINIRLGPNNDDEIRNAHLESGRYESLFQLQSEDVEVSPTHGTYNWEVLDMRL